MHIKGSFLLKKFILYGVVTAVNIQKG